MTIKEGKMKKYIHFKFIFLLVALFFAASAVANNDSNPMTGPYIGQSSLGKALESVATGIISAKGWQLQNVFAIDMN